MKRARRAITFSTCFDIDQLDFVELTAERKGLSRSEYLRELVNREMSRVGAEKKESFSPASIDSSAE